MPTYTVCYYEGMNMNLTASTPEVLEASSFAEALAAKTTWPVFEARDHLSATAQNPGTCVYYTQMWEATLLEPEKATKKGFLGDFTRLRY